MSTIRAVPADPVTPTSTVFATPESTPRTSTSPPNRPPGIQAVSSPPRAQRSSLPPIRTHQSPPPPPPPGAEPAHIPNSSPPRTMQSAAPRHSSHHRTTSNSQSQSQSQSQPQTQPQTQTHQRTPSSNTLTVPSRNSQASHPLSFNPASVTSQPVASGALDVLLPTTPPQTIRVYACAPDICVVDYPPTCNPAEARYIASSLHDDNLRATLAVAGVVGDYAPHLSDNLVPHVERLPKPVGKREIINPRGQSRFESRAAPLPKLTRRGRDVYAIQWVNGPKPFVMDFKGQNVGMDPNTGAEDQEMLSMLVVVLRKAVASGELENGSARSSEERVQEKMPRNKKENDVGGCKCVIM